MASISKVDPFLLLHWPFGCLQCGWQRVAGWIGCDSLRLPQAHNELHCPSTNVLQTFVLLPSWNTFLELVLSPLLKCLHIPHACEHCVDWDAQQYFQTDQGKQSVKSKPVACLSWHTGTTQTIHFESSHQATQSLSFATCKFLWHDLAPSVG